MIEELRVSLFAQSLGTPAPVSEQRIMAALDRLGRELTGSATTSCSGRVRGVRAAGLSRDRGLAAGIRGKLSSWITCRT